jgi:hypothetical protein
MISLHKWHSIIIFGTDSAFPISWLPYLLIAKLTRSLQSSLLALASDKSTEAHPSEHRALAAAEHRQQLNTILIAPGYNPGVLDFFRASDCRGNRGAHRIPFRIQSCIRWQACPTCVQRS